LFRLDIAPVQLPAHLSKLINSSIKLNLPACILCFVSFFRLMQPFFASFELLNAPTGTDYRIPGLHFHEKMLASTLEICLITHTDLSGNTTRKI
jgi:hypothetical protein